MRRQHPDRKMDIPISMEIWQKLLGASQDSGYQKEDWEIAAEAIDEWTRRHRPDAISMPLVHGYQWKSAFLPDGTLLRTVFGGKNYHCLVEGDRILYNGQAVSPSGFVNAVGGIRRNAWRCTWILFPDAKDWTLADTLRTGERPRRAPAKQPAARPSPGPSEYTAASTPEAAQVQHARSDQAPRKYNRRQHTCMTLAPRGLMCDTDRRMKGNDRIEALLRQELLPLLYRMSALDDGCWPIKQPAH